jgi:broad specificity phosphatase PhoE
MKLYIVRHGESTSNGKRIHQSPDSPLSEAGVKQTKELAKRVLKIPEIELIICSPYVRTKQTLEEILKYNELPVVISGLASETRKPSEFIGQSWDDPSIIKIEELIESHMNDTHWHYSDEENFFDLKVRVTKLIDLIESYGGKNILLVSHGILMKLIVGMMLFGRDLSPKEYYSLEEFLTTKNTGITVCEKKEDRWQMLTCNDHAHLG